jgi:ribosomal protein L11 methyltransferase
MTAAERRWIALDVVLDPACLPPGLAEQDLVGLALEALRGAGCLGAEESADGRRLTAWFEQDADVAAAAAGLGAALAGAARIAGRSEVADGGWVEAFNRSLRPVGVGRRLTILPAGGEPPPGRLALRIAPGRAFGTGHHESTRLALEWLEDVIAPGATVLDVGTGTGILALAAARLGAREVRGTDDDPEAVDVARENAAGNALSGAARFELARGCGSSARAHDVVVANITLDVLLPLLPELARRVRPGGCLVLSGLLGGDERVVEAALSDAGLQQTAWRRQGEWSSPCARAGAKDP